MFPDLETVVLGRFDVVGDRLNWFASPNVKRVLLTSSGIEASKKHQARLRNKKVRNIVALSMPFEILFWFSSPDWISKDVSRKTCYVLLISHFVALFVFYQDCQRIISLEHSSRRTLIAFNELKTLHSFSRNPFHFNYKKLILNSTDKISQRGVIYPLDTFLIKYSRFVIIH